MYNAVPLTVAPKTYLFTEKLPRFETNPPTPAINIIKNRRLINKPCMLLLHSHAVNLYITQNETFAEIALTSSRKACFFTRFRTALLKRSPLGYSSRIFSSFVIYPQPLSSHIYICAATRKYNYTYIIAQIAFIVNEKKQKVQQKSQPFFVIVSKTTYLTAYDNERESGVPRMACRDLKIFMERFRPLPK